MSVELIKYAFISGEISRTLFGRTDLTKYDLGLALAKNWFVDYRGGLSTRPGLEFVDYIKHDDRETKFFEFRFSPDLSNTYVILFGHNYVRFIQDGAYVLEEAKNITGVGGSTITIPAHGYSTGDWVKLEGLSGTTQLNGRSFIVTVVTPNTFTLTDPGSLQSVLFEAGSGGTASRVYEIASPYPAEQLKDLSAFQFRDLVRLTHPLYRIRNLNRTGHTAWNLTIENTASTIPRVPNLTGDMTSPPGDSGMRASVVYAVAAVMDDDSEGPISRPILLREIVNFTVEVGSVLLSWGRVAGAKSYNIYRSHVAAFSTANLSSHPEITWLAESTEMGYLGNSRGLTFTDSNIIPDFTKGPIIGYDPFAEGSVLEIEVVNGGTGYPYGALVTLTHPTGSGFMGYAITNHSGELTGVIVQRGGRGYTQTGLVVNVDGGSGATFTVDLSETTELTHPSISTLFQQRQMYAASRAAPLTLWGSQVKRYSNFVDMGDDDGGYEFELDSAEVAAIRHMLSMRGGLLLMSQTGIWLLTGAPTGGPVTPTNALADPQDYTGVSAVPPLKIGTDLLYIEGKGTSVRLLSYNDFSKVYSGEDRSILSSHLFSITKQITRWTFADNPFKQVYAVRSDGALILFTIVKEQDVFAWTWGETRGLFKDIISIGEDGFDRVYVTVQRFINGRWRKYIERFADRNFTHVEDAWAVDAGAKLNPPPVNTTLTISPEFIEGENHYALLASGSPVFTGAAGHIVRAGGGIFLVSEVINPSLAKGYVRAPVTAVIPEDPENTPLPVLANEWTMSPGYQTITGLHHLDGMTVSILGDGNVFPQQVVTNGTIELTSRVSKAIVGLPFTAIAQTLPPVVNDVPVEGKRKRTVGVGVRLHESRGLLAGRTLNELYHFKSRTTESYGEPTRLVNGIKHILLSTDWDENGQTYFVVEDPLPASILGLIPDMEFGDDND